MRMFFSCIEKVHLFRHRRTFLTVDFITVVIVIVFDDQALFYIGEDI